MPDRGAAALDLARQGADVIRLHGLRADGTCTCRAGADCKSPGKHPTDDKWASAERIPDDELVAQWDGWRAGHNVGVRTGHRSGWWVMDVDRAEALDELEAEVGSLPRTHTTRTGSGLLHLRFRMPPDWDLGCSSGSLPKGLDVRGNGGQVVVPPSVTAKGAYVVLDDAPVAEAPAALLDRLRPKARTARRTPSTAQPATELHPYAATVRAEELGQLDALAARPWQPGARWDGVTFSVACNQVELANSPWSGYSLEQAHADLLAHAPKDDAWGVEEHEAKWSSALAKVGDAGRPEPARMAGGFFPSATSSTDAAPEAKDEAPARREPVGAAAVVQHVQEHYEVGVTPEGEAFAVPRQGARVPVMLGERGGRLRDDVTAALYELTGKVTGGKAVDDGMRVVVAQARAGADRTPLHLRVAEHGDGLVLDLAQPGSGMCAVVRPGSVEVLDNPPPGVLFRRTSATRPLPTPLLDGGSLEPLRELLGFAPEDPRWALIRGWLVAALFPTIPRPLVCMVGAPGSAKTSRTRAVLSVIDPREELGSNFGRKIEDDQVKAQSRYLVSYDNLGSVSEAVSDHLCRLVTGDEIDRRRLYSDGDLFTINYRRTGGLTAVGLPPLRADALERVVVLALDRIPEADRRSEVGLRETFAQQHPVVLGGLLAALAQTLTRLPGVRASATSRPRMADYFDVLTAYDPRAASAYLDAAQDVMAEAAEADPFVVAVQGWLSSVGGSWTGSGSDAWAQADRHRRQHGSVWSEQWWPKGGPQFGTALTKATEPLRAVGIEVSRTKSNGRRLLTLQSAAGAGTAQGQHRDSRDSTGTAIELPLSLPSAQVRAGIDPDRDSRDSTSGWPSPCALGEVEGERGAGAGGGRGSRGPANAVPAVPDDPEQPFDGCPSVARPVTA